MGVTQKKLFERFYWVGFGYHHHIPGEELKGIPRGEGYDFFFFCIYLIKHNQRRIYPNPGEGASEL